MESNDLQRYEDYLFIFAGQRQDSTISDNIRLLDRHTKFHHPDLINAADLLICKSGYSTIAECQQTATPICCIGTELFPESKVLERYVSKEMNGVVINEAYFFSGDWLEDLDEILNHVREPLPVNGADLAAEFILSII